MEYGHFDDNAKEYVITNPATPQPWANYLGSPEYGALISNNAGGYSFAQSGANGRILRYVFNQFDQPGRYVYILDQDSGDYWSASWQPVGKDVTRYHSECRHGLGYTKIFAGYAGIRSEVLYYVPIDAQHEVWAVVLENRSDKVRHLITTGYCEFTNENNYEQDQINLQYSLFISRTLYENNMIRQQINGNLDLGEEQATQDGHAYVERFFGMAGAQVDSFCGDKRAFLGDYRTYANPIGVSSGNLGNVLSYNNNSCGALSTEIILAPGEKKTFCFVLGMKYKEESTKILREYEVDVFRQVKTEMAALRSFWNSRLSHLHVTTPSKEFNTMLNIWNAYNCYMTFTWSRAASFIYCGLRNGYGYRDTVQDIQGVIHLAPEEAKEKISFMLSAQVNHGGGLPLVKFTHQPGHEDTPEDASYRQSTGHPAYRADDALWLFPTVYKYLSETGDVAYLDEVIPYANKGEDSVYEHLKKAISFSLNHLGPHGLPAGLYADWNDCLRLGANGESSFVALQFYYALKILKILAEEKKDEEEITFLEEKISLYGEKIQKLCWDEDRFIRGYTEDGQVIGGREAKEASLWLNPQSWAVISGIATKEQSEKIMQLVFDELNTNYGAQVMAPPYHAHAFDGALAVIFNQGTKENAGIFSQPQGWLILAEALLGDGDRAFEYFMENAPAAQNKRAEIRGIEPYAYGQFTEGKDSPNTGRSHVHWLTGTASTMMVGCVEGILGIRPDLGGIHLSPSIPKDWDGFTMEKDFRGKKLNITVKNPYHKSSGASRLTVNGQELEGDYIPVEKLNETNEICLVL
ncbi:Cellobiose phosphorylase [Lachnospiraceae bacterium C10]|nr:Cellobiose phosphorylase [Lachnospiraceae bacterium C10]